MGWIWDLVFIASIIGFLVGPILKGTIPLPLGVAALLLLVFFRALGRSRGGNLGRAIRTTFTVSVPVAGLAYLVVTQGQGDSTEMAAIAGGIAVLSIVVFGFYLMVRGMLA